MAVRNTPKKTVSFSEKDIPVKDTYDDENNGELDDGIQIPFSIKTIPFHYLLIVYSILKQDISTGNVLNNLINNFYALILTQLCYTFLFITNIVELTKKHHRNKNVKLTLSKDFNILMISIMISFILIIPIYILIVLFGAPFTTYLKENLILSSHISFIIFPIIVAFLKIGEKAIFHKYLAFIAVGAWFGAIVIPLDWDRDWQNWPLPIVISCYLLSFIGYSIAGVL